MLQSELDLIGLTPKETTALLRILEEYDQTGQSDLLTRIIRTDWDRTPVGIDQFLDDPYYMGGDALTRKGTIIYPVWREELRYVLNPDHGVYEWIIEGAIGSGKTTVAMLALIYKLYELTCMRSPQELFRLAGPTKIYFAFFNVTVELAHRVGFSTFQSLVRQSPYFQQVCAKPITQQKRPWGDVSHLIFPKNIDAALGSNISHALGQAVYGGILDEANFGRIEVRSRSAAMGQVYKLYNAVRARYTSRFNLKTAARGLLCLVSSTQTDASFLEAHKKTVMKESGVHISNYAQWEVREEYRNSKRFFVMTGDQATRARIFDERPPEDEIRGRLVEVPEDFRTDFERDIDVALRDLAGLATFGTYPLIAFRDRVTACVNETRHHPYDHESVVVSIHDALAGMEGGPLIEHFRKEDLLEKYDEIRHLWRPKAHPDMPRYIHVDLALTGDACGFAMGHPYGIKTVERRDRFGMAFRPQEHRIWIDLMVRIKNAQGSEIDFSQIVVFIEYLARSGFPIRKVTYDGFQSAHSMQILRKSGYMADRLSVDMTPEPYLQLKAALYEKRLDIYRYDPFLREITQVQYDAVRQKVDHLPAGEKDVSDSVAGVVFSIMTDKKVPIPVTAEDVTDLRAAERPAIPVEMKGLIQSFGASEFDNLFKEG